MASSAADPLFHFSEDPSIRRFEPRRGAPDRPDEPLVWAIDAAHADLYLFPRDCPRVCFWRGPATTDDDVRMFLGSTSARRVAVVEAAWLPAMHATVLYRYGLPAASFELADANAGYWVSHVGVEALRVEPVGDLPAALAAAGVEVRVLPRLGAMRDAVIQSTLAFSIIRMRNATP